MARVLVVDDEEFIRFTLRQMLEKAGHEVVEAVNGQDALDCFERSPIDLVITDIVMPEKEGIETIVELRRHQPDLKIIAVSGGGRTKTMDYLDIAERLGADSAIAKPLQRQVVMDAVNKALGQTS